MTLKISQKSRKEIIIVKRTHNFFIQQDQLTTHVHHKVKLQVYMYHGPDRTKDVSFLSQQDIVITTYSTLSNDYNIKVNTDDCMKRQLICYIFYLVTRRMNLF